MDDKKAWVEDQMSRAGVPEDIQELINSYLEDLWEMELDIETTAKVVGTFAELAQGHVLVPDEPEAVWIPAKPGMLVVRDRVRVRADAYQGAVGIAHNGREGSIVAIRYGDIHVRYTDGKQPNPEFIKHSPHALEKRVR